MSSPKEGNDTNTATPEEGTGTTTAGQDPKNLTVSTNDNEQRPRYFSGQYEYEISPKSDTFDDKFDLDDDDDSNSSKDSRASSIASDIIIIENMVPITKTIYLIRHAESDENRRLASLTKCFRGLAKFKAPERNDVMASLELINVQEQIDSNVSPVGETQINQLGDAIAHDNFVEKMGIQLVAHSPLKRARQTSLGMLGCVTPHTNVSTNDDPSAEGKKAPTVDRVVELPILKERTPMEWLPLNHDVFTKRITDFEQWLGEQPEDVIAIVGHSQYFKSMLGLPKKFKNCDVWSLQFDNSIKMTHQSVKKEINTVESARAQKKMKKKLNQAFANVSVRNNKSDTSPVSDNNSNSNENDNDNEKETLDSVPDISTTNVGSSEVYEHSNEIYEIDGVRVDDLKLPRGWRELKRHYTFDASLAELEE